MHDLDQRITARLDHLAASGRRRHLGDRRPLALGRVEVDGQPVIDFSSNDTLGLSRHPLLAERAEQWTQRWGTGSRASRLVTGHWQAIDTLESRIARAKQSPAALIFASGWQANASILPALLEPELWDGTQPQVLADRLIHASLHAGIRMAGAPLTRYRHNDLGHLAELLAKPGPKLVVTESVFSMDGDVADVAALAGLCRAAGALLYLDEAHATGVMGDLGFGLSPGLGVDIAMGTFSKALGGFGAYVACSAAVRDWLINRASGFLYATAPPPPVLGAIDAALDLVPTMGDERRRLALRGQRVRAAFAQAGLDTGASASPIIPVMLGGEDRALAGAAALLKEGLLGVAIRPPTVPPGTARIRFTLSLAHSDDDIDRLIAVAPRVLR